MRRQRPGAPCTGSGMVAFPSESAATPPTTPGGGGGGTGT